MNFMEFILDNFFIIAIILFGVYNFLQGSKSNKTQDQDKMNENQNKQNDRKPVSTSYNRTEQKQPSKGSFRETLGRKVENKLEEFAQNLEAEPKETLRTLEEQRQEQYDRLKQHIQRDSNHRGKEVSERPHKADLERTSSINNDLNPMQNSHEKITVGQINLKEKLTPEGLIDSVIMAEVLGPPRAQSPYRNIASKRRVK